MDGSERFILPDANATLKLGQYLGQTLPPNTVILLEGELGTGKTTLVQGLGQGLGITEPIVSPTFTLINEYTEGRLPLYHLDLYRLESASIEALYLEQYWDETEKEPGITAIEWANRLPELPSTYLHLHLCHTPTATRQITITAQGVAVSVTRLNFTSA